MNVIFLSSLLATSRALLKGAMASIERGIVQFRADNLLIIAQNVFFAVKDDVATLITNASEAAGADLIVTGRYMGRDKQYIIKSVAKVDELSINEAVKNGLPAVSGTTKAIAKPAAKKAAAPKKKAAKKAVASVPAVVDSATDTAAPAVAPVAPKKSAAPKKKAAKKGK